MLTFFVDFWSFVVVLAFLAGSCGFWVKFDGVFGVLEMGFVEFVVLEVGFVGFVDLVMGFVEFEVLNMGLVKFEVFDVGLVKFEEFEGLDVELSFLRMGLSFS